MKPILLAAFALSLPFAAVAQGPDDLWEVTMKMEMAGMPMSMPAMTNKVCSPKSRQDDQMVPMDKDCKVLESKRTGSRFAFKFRCEGGRNNYTGTGEMEYQGKDAYTGKMHAVGTMEGEAVDMTNTWSGKRVGNCTYEDPAKKAEQYKAAANAQIDKACNEGLESLTTQLFVGDAAICKDRKAEFCARAGKAAEELRDPAAMKRYAQKDWRNALTACGRDPEPIMKQACGTALAKRDGEFLRDNCPAEAVAARKQFCLGRTYTSVEASARDLCSALGGLSYTADKPAASAPAADPKSSIGDKLKDGANKLKKFLKF